MSRHPELLIPASSLEVLKPAVVFGADAVYIGGEAFGLRAKAKNFSMEEMKEGIEFAHEHDVKVYVTANILAHNDDLEGTQITELIISGIARGRAVLYPQGSFLLRKLRSFAHIFPRILRSRHSSMAQCASPIPDAACSAITLPGEMPTGERAPIHAAGSTLWWRRQDRESTCLFMRMNGELIFLTQRICV